MPQLAPETLKSHVALITALESERSVWITLWRELSDNYLPQRYRWLMNAKEYYSTRARRQYIINNTGTNSARTLAAGMLNGITSPSRPWLKLRVPGIDSEQDKQLAIWLEQCEAGLLRILAHSNFYNSMAVLYLDMVVFGTGASLMYEDRETVIRCYNPPLGEYMLQQSDRMQVDTFARKFNLKVSQYVQRWPDQRYWSDRVKTAVQQAKTGQGGQLMQDVEISHVIAPNLNNIVPKRFKYYEVYWESRRSQADKGTADVLELKGFNELPGIFARWELSGSDAYGVSPGMDALGDNIALQHQEREEAQLLEKSHKPPVLADVVLSNTPTGLFPGGVTYVPNLQATTGARPIYTVDPRFDQLNIRQQALQERIKNAFFNFLFTGISDLQTVRSAAEIDSRETEKLILLGGVLERFQTEGLDPAVQRAFAIAMRAGLLPEPPPQYRDLNIEIQYISILAVAQRAVGTAPVERYLALIGNMAAVHPDALDVPNFDKILTNYGRNIGVSESEINSPDEIAAARAAKNAPAAGQQAMDATTALSGAAKNLSQTPVGGGASALDRLLGSGAGGSFRPLG